MSNSSTSSPLKRARKNFAKLLGGRGVAAVLELLSVALLARTLSPDHLGYIVLVQAYVLIVRGLFNFKLYEVLVRFGVPLLEKGDKPGFKQLLKLTLAIDFLSVLVATLVAIVSTGLVAKIFVWDASLPPMAMIYSVVLLSYGFGTAKGILRIFDRYDLLGIQLMIGPVLRLAGVVAIMYLPAPSIMKFLLVLAVATIIGNLYLIITGLQELGRQDLAVSLKELSVRHWKKNFPGLAKFIRIVYWQSNVDMLPKYISTMLAGTFLGPAGAAYLRLGREASKVLSKPGSLLRQVLFPDLVRMWERRSLHFHDILRHALLISAAFGLFFTVLSVFAGAWLFALALGPEYAQAAPLLSWLLFASTLELMATVLRAAGYPMGHAGRILHLHVYSGAIYLLAFVILTPWLGLSGAGIAACVAALVPLIGIGRMVAQSVSAANLQAD